MNRIPISIPVPGAQVTGELYDAYAPEDLDQDLLQVALPNGLVIDVGWYPGGDSSGAFKVVVYRDYWRNQIAPPVITTNPHEAADAVVRLAREQSQVPRVFDSENGVPRDGTAAERTP